MLCRCSYQMLTKCLVIRRSHQDRVVFLTRLLALRMPAVVGPTEFCTPLASVVTATKNTGFRVPREGRRNPHEYWTATAGSGEGFPYLHLAVLYDRAATERALDRCGAPKARPRCRPAHRSALPGGPSRPATAALLERGKARPC